MDNQERLDYYQGRYENSKRLNNELRHQNMRLRQEVDRLGHVIEQLYNELNQHKEERNEDLRFAVSEYLSSGPKEAKTKIVMIEVAKSFGVTIDEIMSKSRLRKIVIPRQVIHQILYKKIQGYSLSEIGELTGGYDHATIVHSNKMVSNQIEIDREFKSKYNSTLKRILARLSAIEAGIYD